MLPDNDIWCNAVLAVIEKDDPMKQCQHESEAFGLLRRKGRVHSLRVQRLAGVEIQVAEVGQKLFGVIILHTLLEPFDVVFILASRLELLDDLLQISYSSRTSVKRTDQRLTHDAPLKVG